MHAWIVERVAIGYGIAVDPVALGDRPVSGVGLDAIEPLAGAVGLQVSRIGGGLEDILRIATPTLPVLAEVADGALWLVEGARNGRVQVCTGAGPESTQRMTMAELRAALGPKASFALLEAAFAFDPEGAKHGHGAHVTTWMRLWRLTRMESSDLWIVIVYAAMLGVLSLVVPIAVQTLVNTVVFGTFFQPLVWLSLMMFVGLLCAVALQMAQFIVVELLERRVFVRLVAELGYRIPRVTQQSRDVQNTSVLVNRFFDVLTVQKSLSTLLLDGVSVVVTGIAGTALLVFYSPWFLFYAVVLWVGLAALVIVTGRNAPATAVAESYAKHAVAAWVEQIAANPQLFRSAGAARWASVRSDSLARTYLRARVAHFRIWFRQAAGLLLLSAVASTSLLGLGGWLVLTGALTIGQLLAAEMVVMAVLGSFAKLGKQLGSLYDLLAALDKIGSLLDLPLERGVGDRLPTRTGAIGVEVRGARFCFGDGRMMFDTINLDIRAGERVALVGSGGSGRGILLDLIHGTREPSEGFLRVDGVDLREARLTDLRERVAMVRGIELVEGTVVDNVRVGRTDVSDIEVRRVLAQVGLLDEVATLHGGLRLTLGPWGKPLSGSQSRRLVLARALAGRPGALLIDDLLDGIPKEARGPVLDAIFNVERSMTVIVVTRDPEVIARCDRQLVFERPRPGAPSEIHGERGAAWGK